MGSLKTVLYLNNICKKDAPICETLSVLTVVNTFIWLECHILCGSVFRLPTLFDQECQYIYICIAELLHNHVSDVFNDFLRA